MSTSITFFSEDPAFKVDVALLLGQFKKNGLSAKHGSDRHDNWIEFEGLTTVVHLNGHSPICDGGLIEIHGDVLGIDAIIKAIESVGFETADEEF
jgi:hypothetical protein